MFPGVPAAISANPVAASPMNIDPSVVAVDATSPVTFVVTKPITPREEILRPPASIIRPAKVAPSSILIDPVAPPSESIEYELTVWVTFAMRYNHHLDYL